MQSWELYRRSHLASGQSRVDGRRDQRWLCLVTLLVMTACAAAVQAGGQVQAPPATHETASSDSAGPVAAPASPPSGAATGSKDNNIRVNVQVVNVPVTVLDKRGTP